MGSEWEEVTLGDAAVSVQTGPFGSQLHKADYVDEGIPSIMPVNISDNRITTEGIARITEADAERLSKYRVEAGDVVYSRRGDVERRALVREAEDGWLCGTGCLRVRFDKARVNPEYASFQLGNTRCREWIVRHAIGATMPNLNTSILSAVPFILPPLPEQKAIAHILGTLDDKIELNRRMNATLEGMAQALFKSWFVDFDPVIDNALAAGKAIPDELAPRAEVRKNALASSGELGRTNGTTQQGSVDHPTLSDHKSLFSEAFEFTEELGWIPEGWDSVRFDELVSAKQGRYLAKTDMVETADSVFKYPVWGGNGILGFSSSYAYDEPITLMTCRGSNCGLIKFTESSAWISNNSFACPTKYGSQYFLYLYFRNESFEECVSGSAQPQITYTAIKNKVMKLPISEPICEQFSNLVQSYKERQAQNASQNETLIKLRDTLLPKLISGEIRVSDAEKCLQPN